MNTTTTSAHDAQLGREACRSRLRSGMNGIEKTTSGPAVQLTEDLKLIVSYA